MATVSNAYPARDLVVEVFELPDETPRVLLTLAALDHENGGEVFAAFVLELNLETMAALARGACRVAGVLELVEGMREC